MTFSEIFKRTFSDGYTSTDINSCTSAASMAVTGFLTGIAILLWVLLAAGILILAVANRYVKHIVVNFRNMTRNTLDFITELPTASGSKSVRNVPEIPAAEAASLMAHRGEVTFWRRISKKRLIALACLLALCCSLCGCGLVGEEAEEEGPSLSQVMADRKKQEDDTPSREPQPEKPQPEHAPDAYPLYEGDTFTLTIREINDRLDTIARDLCPGITVNLVISDWSATTELRYNGLTFCQLTYYSSDDYLDNPYPEHPMNGDMLDLREVRYINVLDFPNQPHPDNSFLAIATTFDPRITEAQAKELADFLVATRGEYGQCYLVTALNGIGYGHAYPMNQMEISGSIVIRAGCSTPELCVHDVEYEFTQNGAPYGVCSKCDQFVSPAAMGKALISMTAVKDTNSASGNDIMAGEFYDPVGAKYWDALKFWVIDQEGYNNTEHITYALDKEYSTICGTIVSAAESEPGAEMWIEIYLDDRLIYTSEKVGYYDYATYMVDIHGGSTLRIACITDTNAHGHCVVTSMVY